MKSAWTVWIISGLGLIFNKISQLWFVIVPIFVLSTLYIAVILDDKLTGRTASLKGSPLDHESSPPVPTTSTSQRSMWSSSVRDWARSLSGSRSSGQ